MDPRENEPLMGKVEVAKPITEVEIHQENAEGKREDSQDKGYPGVGTRLVGRPIEENVAVKCSRQAIVFLFLLGVLLVAVVLVLLLFLR